MNNIIILSIFIGIICILFTIINVCIVYIIYTKFVKENNSNISNIISVGIPPKFTVEDESVLSNNEEFLTRVISMLESKLYFMNASANTTHIDWVIKNIETIYNEKWQVYAIGMLINDLRRLRQKWKKDISNK